ncbi:RagB/SusD family nutrient uptake outer membrane protein [Mucilaginibacter sp. KACC 22773]|uniref:RagB/SusD family nutrient uptake outer membrane protein n=1 Tax=Mucilaginibacter sp. KACC 22773 TaxID=3025671 RepID=UPI002366D86E|nr:RagB/SusD family nutrient uptake outer membrane protein [Mucilaginibacter sp. KACC 22773]WDF77173.1 RagB/SusD family nutrient uptake outer membrane protein [Mucilaginibacter sp. KACC 22773]
MKYKITSIHNATFLLAFITIAFVCSCKKYVDVPIAPGLLTTEKAFASDSSATSAVLSLYNYSATNNSIQYYTWTGGLQADELQYTGTDPATIQFEQNQIFTNNPISSGGLWGYPYTAIRFANSAIEQINISKNITQPTKDQLSGEAKFMRAFMFFYLSNFFGDVPLTLDPNPLNNAKLSRATSAQVYDQIITDLKSAQSLLTENYAGNAAHRARVNKLAATALLARVYLYRKDYRNAQEQANLVINSGAYGMPALNEVFTNNSPEVILQFATNNGVSTIGSQYRTNPGDATSPPPTYVLFNNFVRSFERGDNRRTAWIDSTNYNNTTYYRIYKNKIADQSQGNNEYDVVLRLAEQYLISAEAKAQQGNVAGAASDLNVVRRRAGLRNTTANTQAALLTAILQERKVELFGEFAHRWLDLKRTDQANAVLGPLKPTWKPTAVLNPIPNQDILLNNNLTQNPGY